MTPKEAVLKAAEMRKAVPVLPGEMPDEMWAVLSTDRDAATEALRILVRQTCDEYEAAIRAFAETLESEPEGWVLMRKEEVLLLEAVLNQARETLFVSIKGTTEDLQRSLGTLNLKCKKHWDYRGATLAASAAPSREGKP